jgi:hypothetical protein
MKGFKYRLAVKLLEFAIRHQWVWLMELSDSLRRSSMEDFV